MVNEVTARKSSQEYHFSGVALHTSHIQRIQVHFLEGINIITNILGHIRIGSGDEIQQFGWILTNFPKLFQELLIDIFLLSLAFDKLFHFKLFFSPFRCSTPSQTILLALPDKGMFHMLIRIVARLAKFKRSTENTFEHMVRNFINSTSRTFEFKFQLFCLVSFELLVLCLQLLEIVGAKTSSAHGASHTWLSGRLVLDPNSKTFQMEAIPTLDFAVAERLAFGHVLLANGTHWVLIHFDPFHLRFCRKWVMLHSFMDHIWRQFMWGLIVQGWTHQGSHVQDGVPACQQLGELTVHIGRLPEDGVLDLHFENPQQNIQCVNAMVIFIRTATALRLMADWCPVLVTQSVLECETQRPWLSH